MFAPWLSPVRPADRVGIVIARTPDFAWAFRFLQEFPSASLALVGGSVRDALVGHVSHCGHLLITNASPIRVSHWMTQTPPPAFLNVTLSSRPLGAFLASQLFTPNALGYDIGRGLLHDPFDGISALQRGLLTTVRDPHDLFHDRPHEALRALRLSAQLGVSPAPQVWRAVLSHAPRVNHLTTDEAGFATYRTPRKTLVREALLALKHGAYGWDLFSRGRALPLSFPHLVGDTHSQANLHFLSVHDRDIRSRYGEVPLSDELTLASLYTHHENRAEHYLAHAERMDHGNVSHPRLNVTRTRVAQTLAKTHALLTENPSLWSLSRTEKILGGSQGNAALSLAHIATIHNSQLNEQASHIARAALTRDTLVRDVRPAPLLHGRDLLPLGLSSGPHIRLYLNRVRDEQLKGDLQTKEDALSFVRYLVRKSEEL
jgi:hypothetical protein